jgi:hypothetical protein
MVKTKETKAAEVRYIVKDVMGFCDTSPVPEVLNVRSIIDVDGIASMSFTTIDKLTYKDPDDQSNKPLNAGDKQLLTIFVMYTHRLTDDILLPEDWNSNTIDANAFCRFQMLQEPHTGIDCLYNNTDYKEVIAAALHAWGQPHRRNHGEQPCSSHRHVQQAYHTAV